MNGEEESRRTKLNNDDNDDDDRFTRRRHLTSMKTEADDIVVYTTSWLGRQGKARGDSIEQLL